MHLCAKRRADGPELAENLFWLSAQFGGMHKALFNALCECDLFFLRHCFLPFLMFEVERSQAITSSRLKRRYFPGRKQGKGLRERARVRRRTADIHRDVADAPFTRRRMAIELDRSLVHANDARATRREMTREH